MPKISDLPAMTSPHEDDELPINDESVPQTKRMTLTKLKEWLQSVTGWVKSTMLDFTSGGQMVAFTNSGTGGGAGWYINLGGMKILVVLNVSMNASAWRTIDYTAVGFTEPPALCGNAMSQGSNTGGWIEFTATPGGSGSPSATSCGMLARRDGGNTNSLAMVIAIGK